MNTGDSMKIEEINEYREHGCNIVGDLIMVKYTHLMDKPSVHNFGSMSIFTLKDKALALVKKDYPDAIVALAIPDLVCHKNK